MLVLWSEAERRMMSAMELERLLVLLAVQLELRLSVLQLELK
jgi:hypothetical protein